MHKNIFDKKKLPSILSLLIAILLLSVSCNKINNNTESHVTADNIIEIRERMFIGQVNEIYLNANDYLGKIIKLEGVFKQEQHAGNQYNFVVRYGPGCCGDDGLVGFYVSWAENQIQEYPKEDSWVEAIGELKLRRGNGTSQYPYLELSSLAVLDRRGVEFVTQ